MAAARDQAARILRTEPDTADGRDRARSPPLPADRAQPSRRDGRPPPRGNAGATGDRDTRDRKPGRGTERPAAGRRAEIGKAPTGHDRRIGALLALAAAAYGVHYLLVGRFYVSTDDAYVRANNTTLGARVSGHIAAILPGDNALVHTGEVIFRIDDGDYRIAVDAARTKIATQQATIDRIGRQVTALESAVEQAKAQLASAEAGLEAGRTSTSTGSRR